MTEESIRIERLTHNIQRIREGMEDMRVSMKEMQNSIKEMAVSMNKLAVVEERQNQHHSSMERAFNAIDNLSKKHDAAIYRLATSLEKANERIAVLERHEQLNAQIRVGVLGLIGVVGVALIYAFLRFIGVQT